MDLRPLLQFAKDYASWEILGAVSAFFGKDLFKSKTAQAKDMEKAAKDGATFLTPDGWETDRLRFENSNPIKPR
jgi:hypothetical protein